MPQPKKQLTRNSLTKLAKDQEICAILPTNILPGPRSKKATRKAAELYDEDSRSGRKRGESNLGTNKRSSTGSSLPAMSPGRSRIYTIPKTTRTQPMGGGGLRNPPSSSDKAQKKRKAHSTETDSDSDYEISSQGSSIENFRGNQNASRRHSVVLPSTPALASGSVDRSLRSQPVTDQNEDEETEDRYHVPETRLSKRRRVSSPSASSQYYISPYAPLQEDTATDSPPNLVIDITDTPPSSTEVEIIRVVDRATQPLPLKDSEDRRTSQPPPLKNVSDGCAPSQLLMKNGSQGLTPQKSPLKNHPKELTPQTSPSKDNTEGCTPRASPSRKDHERTSQASPPRKDSEGRTPQTSPAKNSSDRRVLPPNRQALARQQVTPVASEAIDGQPKDKCSSGTQELHSSDTSVQNVAVETLNKRLNDRSYMSPPSSIQEGSPMRNMPVSFRELYPDLTTKDEEDRPLITFEDLDSVVQAQDNRRLGILEQVRQSKEFYRWASNIRDLKAALADEEGKKQMLEDGIHTSQKDFESEMTKLNDAFEAVRDEELRLQLQGICERRETKGEKELKTLREEERDLMMAMKVKKEGIRYNEELRRRHYRHAKAMEPILRALLEYVRTLPNPESSATSVLW